jgi:folate-dependent tRNA-U54 methylase TrmFO/GidA
MCGALCDYLTRPNVDFGPINANFGLLPPLVDAPLCLLKDKSAKKAAYTKRALADLQVAIDL